MAEILCKLAKFDRGLDVTDQQSFYNKIGIDDLKYYIKCMWVYGPSMFFEPPRIDQREINQESIFLAECNELYNVFWNKDGQQSEWVDEHNYLQFIIKYFKKLPKDLLDDHLVCGLLKPVDSYNYYHDIRIVIPSNVKKNILNELNFRGINRSFMYPTIENSVETIKKRYQNTEYLLEK